MATVLKTSPRGIDHVIDRIQQRIFTHLSAAPALWTSYQSYHRAYKNPRKDNVIPEVYTSAGEYEEVLFDDKFNVTSFFLAADTRKQTKELVYDHDISVIFQGQLNKLYPAIVHRADEEMHQDIIAAIVKAGFENEISSMITGIKNVYSALKFTQPIDELVSLDDMSNFHVVKVDLSVTYTLDECNTIV